MATRRRKAEVPVEILEALAPEPEIVSTFADAPSDPIGPERALRLMKMRVRGWNASEIGGLLRVSPTILIEVETQILAWLTTHPEAHPDIPNFADYLRRQRAKR